MYRVVNQPLTGSMRDHLDSVIAKIRAGTPFGLIRPSDGEYKILKGESFTNCDQWTFRSGGTLQSQLLEAIKTVDPNLYIGIPCNTCNKPWNCTEDIYRDFISVFEVPLAQRTYANIFGNSNWLPFIEFLNSYHEGFHLVTSGEHTHGTLPLRERHLIDARLVDHWDDRAESETQRLLAFVAPKTNALILFSAGPISKIWIPLCMKAYPTNRYVDVGAALDHFSKGQASRLYVDSGHPFSKEACVFSDQLSSAVAQTKGSAVKLKKLVYVCVFHNEGYVALFELLLRSIRTFSSRQHFDVLVMTSVELEPLVEAAAHALNYPIAVMTVGCSSVFQAACARIHVFDYVNIDQYETLLCLDTDILVTGDLSRLLDLEIGDKLYGCEGADISLPNFGGQFFDLTTIDPQTKGVNSGTLLFRNSSTMRDLFARIRAHIDAFALATEPFPYAMDQPFINYHAVKDGLYDYRALTPHVALFESDDSPANRADATVWHFSFPIGDWKHKKRRMVRHWLALISRQKPWIDSVDRAVVATNASARDLKIAVYAIALNEEQHVHSWCDSVVDADYVVVADTGSTDRTTMFLRARGVTVYPITVNPWRFDEARNQSLSLVPADADVCICLDMDELLLPGWRAKIEALWKPGTQQLGYQFAPDITLEAASMRAYQKEKIHARQGFQWFRPVHEALRFQLGECRKVVTNELLIGQIQDLYKARTSYLPLMIMARQEDPLDAQLCFWLGREQYYAGQLVESAQTLKNYLELPTGNYLERSEVLRFIAKAEPEQAPYWLLRALAEAGQRRETWLDLARYYYDKKDWVNLMWAAVNGLAKSQRLGLYLDDVTAWDHSLHDYASLAYGALGLYERAVESCLQALTLSPKDARLLNNLNFFKRQQLKSASKQVSARMPSGDLSNIHELVARSVAGEGAGWLSNNRDAAEAWRVHVVVPTGVIGALGLTPIAQAVAHGLDTLGFRVDVCTDLSNLSARSIVVGAHLLSAEHMATLPSEMVIYNAEHIYSWWLTGRPNRAQMPYRHLLARSVVWDVSAANAQALSLMINQPVRYVPLGYAPMWSYVRSPQVQDIDVLFYGATHPRREAILQRLATAGVRVASIVDVFGRERDDLMARAKVVLVIAYWLPANFDSVRINYLLANRKAVIRECNVGEESAGDLRSAMIESPYESLVENTLSLLRDEPRRHALAQAGFDLVITRDQGAIMRAALA